MKLIYCIHSVYNPGGMERVLLNKITYLVKNMGWDITVVTTDQKGKAPFYPFPREVRMIDLNINYSDDNNKNIFRKITGYLYRKQLHKKRLSVLLKKEKADIVISLYPSESSFLPDIKDGSKKVLELHFCKFFRLQYGRSGLLGMIDKWRTKQDEKIVSRFDKFVVLTNEDKGYWGDISNIEVIPNAAMNMEPYCSDASFHRIIAVGRLDYQKGFDRLVQAWRIICQSGKYREWHLDIFGQGEWKEMLQRMIDEGGMNDSICINAPTNQIGKEYAKSSIIVMTSNYEGFGMVLVEAMACGVPAIAFDCKCGPKDIISHGKNGLLVSNGDIEGLAAAMMRLMDDEVYRKCLSDNAKKIVSTYSEETIMNRWISLFNSLI